MRNIKYVFLGLFLFLLNPLFAQWKEVKIPFNNPSATKKLKVDLFQSSIKITGSNRSDILVRFQIIEDDDDNHKKDKNKDKEKDKSKGLRKISGSNVNLEMTCNNNVAAIQSLNWNRYINMEIEVPRNIELDISKNIGDTILIQTINGNVNIENNVGDIIVKNISGLVNASTNAGNIVVDFDQIPDPKAMLFTSTTGEVDLRLPANYKANLKMKTEMGEIYSDLDIVIQNKQTKVNTQKENGTFKYFNNSWTHASLNQGGPMITIKSKIGNIYLRKK